MRPIEISVGSFVDDRVHRMYGWAIIIVLACIAVSYSLQGYWPLTGLAIPVIWRAGIAYLQIRTNRDGYDGLFWLEKRAYERWIARTQRSEA